MESRERTRVGMAGGASESGFCDRKHFRRIVQFFEGPIWVRGETFALDAQWNMRLACWLSPFHCRPSPFDFRVDMALLADLDT
jgi:hypothetical protein